MSPKFKLVNKSKINNTRIRLIKTDTSMISLDDLKGAIYENEKEIGICLAPNTIISCVGSKVETDGIVINGDGWFVVVDNEIMNSVSVGFDNMVELLEENGVRVTILEGYVPTEITCYDAEESTLVDLTGEWVLEIDGENLGGPYDLEQLDEVGRTRDVSFAFDIGCQPSEYKVYPPSMEYFNPELPSYLVFMYNGYKTSVWVEELDFEGTPLEYLTYVLTYLHQWTYNYTSSFLDYYEQSVYFNWGFTAGQVKVEDDHIVVGGVGLDSPLVNLSELVDEDKEFVLLRGDSDMPYAVEGYNNLFDFIFAGYPDVGDEVRLTACALAESVGT